MLLCVRPEQNHMISHHTHLVTRQLPTLNNWNLYASFFSEKYVFYSTEQHVTAVQHVTLQLPIFIRWSSYVVWGILFKRKFVIYAYVKEQGNPLDGEIDTCDFDTLRWNSCFRVFSNLVLFYMRRKYNQIKFTRRTTHSSVAHVRQLEFRVLFSKGHLW